MVEKYQEKKNTAINQRSTKTYMSVSEKKGKQMDGPGVYIAEGRTSADISSDRMLRLQSGVIRTI